VNLASQDLSMKPTRSLAESSIAQEEKIDS